MGNHIFIIVGSFSAPSKAIVIVGLPGYVWCAMAGLHHYGGCKWPDAKRLSMERSERYVSTPTRASTGCPKGGDKYEKTYSRWVIFTRPEGFNYEKYTHTEHERRAVLNHPKLDGSSPGLSNCFFRLTTKKTSKLPIVTNSFLETDAENVNVACLENICELGIYKYRLLWLPANERLLYYKRHSETPSELIYWGRVTHICVGNVTIIGSDKDLPPGRRQAIIWSNAGLLLIELIGTNLREILI